VGKGKGYSLNFPLHDGVDDVSFEGIFKDIMKKVMEVYQPGAVVLQCGADSLSGDRLGCFNLTLKGHGACVEYMRSFNVPILVLGGGGYTVRNVARCWAYETSLLLQEKLPEEIPYNDFYEYYGPDYQLHIVPSNMENLNQPRYLETKKISLYEVLRELPTPSIQYTTPIGPDPDFQEEEPDPDERVSQRDEDKRIDDEREFFADDQDQDRDEDMERERDRDREKATAPVNSGNGTGTTGNVAAPVATVVTQAPNAAAPNSSPPVGNSKEEPSKSDAPMDTN